MNKILLSFSILVVSLSLLSGPAAFASQIVTYDFQGVILTDTEGNLKTEFRSGDEIRIEAIFSLNRPGITFIHGTLRVGEWSLKLETKVKIGVAATYNISWEKELPSNVSGNGRVDLTLLSPLYERLIRTAFFMAQTSDPDFDADYTGSDACALCHQETYETWETTRHAPAIGCESCHGPGSEHILTQSKDYIVIDTTAELCGLCHKRNDGTIIEAENGFIKHMQQYNEWSQSAHAQSLVCTTCHNPHYSPSLDKNDAIKISCRDCHSTKSVSLNMQTLLCEDCHMPAAVMDAESDGVGNYREGDRASHIWRINTAKEPNGMFTDEGNALFQDIKGPYLTLNFSCLGCHDGTEARFEEFDSVRHVSTLIH